MACDKGCPGFAIFNVPDDSRDGVTGGDVQRCDGCDAFASDEDVAYAVSAMGCLVDMIPPHVVRSATRHAVEALVAIGAAAETQEHPPTSIGAFMALDVVEDLLRRMDALKEQIRGHLWQRHVDVGMKGYHRQVARELIAKLRYDRNAHDELFAVIGIATLALLRREGACP